MLFTHTQSLLANGTHSFIKLQALNERLIVSMHFSLPTINVFLTYLCSNSSRFSSSINLTPNRKVYQKKSPLSRVGVGIIERYNP